MPEASAANDYKRRFLIYKQWKLKSTPEQAVQNINTSINKDLTELKEVCHWYTQFDQGNIDLVDPKYDLKIYSSNIQINNDSKNVYDNKNPDNMFDSLLHITEIKNDDCYTYDRKIIVKNNRYLFVIDQIKRFEQIISVYNLFRGTKKVNLFSLDIVLPYFDLQIIGDYLFVFGGYYEGGDGFKLFFFRIDYDNLNIEQLESNDVNDYLNGDYTILPDQMDQQKFVACLGKKFIFGQIENDKIVMGEVKNVGKNIDMKYQRLAANKIQGFNYDMNNFYDLDSLKFCELNLDTMERKEINVPIKFNNIDDEMSVEKYGDVCCWSLNQFYAFFEMENDTSRLLSFDPLILKWVDVGIWTQVPMGIFIDENDVATLIVGHYKNYNAYYRIVLRKPEKLMDLTRFTALRESKFYGDNKYLNAMKSLPIEL